MRRSARVAGAPVSDLARDADRRVRTGGHVRAALLAAAAVLLTACASYTPAPIDRKISAEAFASRRLDAPALQAEVARVAPQAAASWPPAEWDRASLLAVALAQNASLAVARAEVEAALAAEISAGEKPNPTLGLQSEYARSEPDQWLYGVSYDFLLPRSAVGKLDIALAQLGTGGARTELTERTWSVRRTLIAALSDRESAARRVDVLAKLAAVQDRLIDTRRQRVAAGEDASTDLNTAQATRIDIEQQLAQARANAATAQAAAAAALGMPPEALDGVTIVWSEWGDPPALTAEGIAAARERALLSRADLAIAVNDYAKAENRLERAIARQYPQFEFKPGYYWDHGIAKWPLDVEFTLPFNRNRGEIAEATAGRELAGQRMLALQATIYGEIEAAVRAEAVARANVDAARARARTVQQQLEHADVALRLGAGDRLDRTDAEVLARRADLEIVQAEADWQSARDVLEDALHAPLSGPELALAKSLSVADPGAGR